MFLLRRSLKVQGEEGVLLGLDAVNGLLMMIVKSLYIHRENDGTLYPSLGDLEARDSFSPMQYAGHSFIYG